MSRVHTVLGDIDTADLGKTLVHEHLVLAFPGWEFDKSPLAGTNAVEKLTKSMRELRDFGVSTVVDPAPIEMGRSADLLARVASGAEIQIVCATGFYHGGIGIPVYWRQRTVDEIVEFFLSEIEHGIGDTGIRAGVIKVATRPADQIVPNEEKLLRAAARASIAAGVPIITHTEQGKLGPEQIDLLTAEGVKPHRILVGHCDQSSDLRYFRKMLEKGAFVGIDQIGWQFYESQPPDEIRLMCLAGLIAGGYLNQLMISQDRIGIWLKRLTPGQKGAQAMVDETGFRHIFESFIPALLKAGISADKIDTMLVDNPRVMFSESRPA